MKLRFRRQGEVIIFYVAEDVQGADGHTLRIAFERAIESQERGLSPKILINLEGTTRMDSSALGALVYAHNRVNEKKGKLCLTGVGPPLSELLTLSRIDMILSQFPDETSALVYLES